MVKLTAVGLRNYIDKEIDTIMIASEQNINQKHLNRIGRKISHFTINNNFRV